MIFQVDFQTGKPVYLQLADQIRYAAASGRLRWSSFGERSEPHIKLVRRS